MINKYGSDGIDKYESWKSNINKFKSGDENPQFGRSPFKNSGMSYKGWYKNIFFRSSLELIFLVNKNEDFVSAETSNFTVKYKFKNKEYNYHPDFYSAKENAIYEIKSKQWMNSELNQIKIKSASDYFKCKNINYIVICEEDIDIYKIYGNWENIICGFLYDMVINKEVLLTDISFNKLKYKLMKTNRIEKLNKLNMI